MVVCKEQPQSSVDFQQAVLALFEEDSWLKLKTVCMELRLRTIMFRLRN